MADLGYGAQIDINIIINQLQKLKRRIKRAEIGTETATYKSVSTAILANLDSVNTYLQSSTAATLPTTPSLNPQINP